MLSELEILTYRELYQADYDLLYVEFEGKEFIFRSLTREEYKEIVGIISDDFEFEDAICQCCLLYPEEYDFSESYLPGLTSSFAKELVGMSMISNIESILDTFYREKEMLKQFDEQCITLVKAAFPEYSYEQIEKWSWKKLIKYTARAENVMRLRGYDISLINKYDELKEELEEKTKDITNKEIGDALRERGIDPMDYFAHEFTNNTDTIDYPVIGTLHWKDEEILDAIRKQMETADEKRKIIKTRRSQQRL